MHDPKHLSLIAATVWSAHQKVLSPVAAAELALEICEAAEEAAASKAGFDRDSERLEVAAEALLQSYPEGHERAGAYVVAFEDLEERLDELAALERGR